MPYTSKPLSLEFFINRRCSPGVVPVKAMTVDVCYGETMIGPEREVSTTVLETDISEAGEHLSTTEVGLGNEPDSST